MKKDRHGKTVPADAAEIGKVLHPFLKGREEIIAFYLFGSMATGKTTPLSDVDIAVLMDERCAISPDYKPVLLAELMSLLRRNDIDAVILNEAPPFLRYRVIRDGILLYEKDSRARIRFHVQSYSTYLDLKPFLRKVYGI